MFSQLVGSVSMEAALVLCVMFGALAVIVVTFIGMYRSKQSLEMQFEIDKTKLHNEDMVNKRQQERTLEYDMAKLAVDRDVQFRRIETGMIEATATKSNYDKS